MSNFITIGNAFYLDSNDKLQYKTSDHFDSDSLDFESNYELTKDFFKELEKEAFMMLVTEIFVFKNVPEEPLVKYWASKETLDYGVNGDNWSEIELHKKE